MINAGSALCLKCGHVLSDSFYYNSTSEVWVVLKRQSDGKYKVEKYTIPGKDYSRFANFKLTEKHYSSVNNMSDTIYVDYLEKDSLQQEKIFNRCCPFCGGNAVFNKFGYLPTYIIAVIGARTVGKSSWIKALSNIENQNELPSSSYPYCIDSSKWEIDIIADEATPLNGIGSTRLFTISKRSTRQTGKEAIANVLLIDFAGELFTYEATNGNNPIDVVKAKNEYDRMCKLLKGTHGYSGADAIVFMDAPDSVYNPVKTYNSVKELGVLEKKPVAYVVNKVDLLFANPPKTILPDSDVKIDLLTEDTFKYNAGTNVYAKGKIVPRVCLETVLASKYKALANRILTENPHSAGFFIQTTNTVNDQRSNDQTNSNMQASVNVLDPIIWLLNELDIFPIV